MLHDGIEGGLRVDDHRHVTCVDNGVQGLKYGCTYCLQYFETLQEAEEVECEPTVHGFTSASDLARYEGVVDDA